MGGYLEGAVPYPADLVERYTRAGWWANETFWEVFERSASRHPDKAAAVDRWRRCSYRELADEVTRLASALADLGVGSRDRVVVQLPNRIEYLVAFYALQRLGAIPVLAVPRHGPAELGDLMRLAAPVAWIFPAQDRGRSFAGVVERLRDDGVLPRLAIATEPAQDLPAGTLAMSELIASQPAGSRAPEVRPDPNDVAVILLTGGVTGRSKAVPRTHNSFLYSIRHANRDAGPDDVFCVVTPVGHTMANQGPVGGAIYHAGTLVFLEEWQPELLLQVVEREHVTRVGLVPTQLWDLLHCPALEEADLSSLRRVGTTGAALSESLARRAHAFFTAQGCTFHSGYGSTEGPALGRGPGGVSEPAVPSRALGRARHDGTEWTVVDEEGNELPAGAQGELAARGPGVFTGYYRAGDENARVFTRSGYYRTGDVGFIDQQGFVHLTGRRKNIIQRGGEAIVPEEIEEMLADHPALRQVAVVGVPDERLGERACACVVPMGSARVTLEEVVGYLGRRGAGRLRWPERLVVMSALPETAAGKVDRVALREEAARRLQEVGSEDVDGRGTRSP